MNGIAWLKVVLPIAAGFGLYKAGRWLETVGDVNKATGDTPSALGCHVGALALMLAALGAFAFALIHLFRGLRGGGAGMAGAKPRSGHARTQAAVAAVDAEPAFDADAVMARYLATRNGGAPVAGTETKPDPRGFGRKRQ